MQPFLERHIARFNGGVRTGDFGPLIAQFAPAAAYASQPPDDEGSGRS